MRIAILGSRGYPSTYGGFETFVRHLAPWLVEQGHEVTVYGRGGGRASSRVVDGVRVVDTLGFRTKSASTVSHGMTAALHCLCWKPDVVLALNVANGPALPLLKARRIPVVMNVDGIEWLRAKWGWLARNGFRVGAWMSARLADVLVADSKEIGRVWKERYGVDSVFIPYGAEVLENACPANRVIELGLEPHGYALAVARLAPENNIELFLDALEELDWKVPAVVVGSANYENPVEARLRDLQEAGRIKWLGHVHDDGLLTQLWAHAGVYFHGHSVGGTNPALLSALGCGAPTVAIDTPFNREVLMDDRQVVDANSSAVADAFATVLGDEGRRRELAAYGRSVIAERYRWPSVFEAYEATMARARNVYD